MEAAYFLHHDTSASTRFAGLDQGSILDFTATDQCIVNGFLDHSPPMAAVELLSVRVQLSRPSPEDGMLRQCFRELAVFAVPTQKSPEVAFRKTCSRSGGEFSHYLMVNSQGTLLEQTVSVMG
jgi:hypothetical protein